jgi:hypothetical protein
MHRYLLALGGALLATLLVAGIAAAGEPTPTGGGGDATTGDATGGDVTQSADQSNVTSQSAAAQASGIQLGGLNLGLNLLSSGDTTQANVNENEATAENSNTTVQVIDQQQVADGGDADSGDATAASGGDCGCRKTTDASTGDAEGGDVKQSADQDNETEQSAAAQASPIQIGGANIALNVLSHGDTTQVNHNENEATAENSNATGQLIGQHQVATAGSASSGDATASGHGADASSGDAEGGDVKQDADQSNRTDQEAYAEASPIQIGGVNLALNVLSKGDTTQANVNENEATARSSNTTVQLIGQRQVGTGGDATSGDASASGHGADAASGDAEGGDVKQSADQDNATWQSAYAGASPIQIGGANVALNFLSHGDTTQVNHNENEATAKNSNTTVQVVDQDQLAKGGDAVSGEATAVGSAGCGCHDSKSDSKHGPSLGYDTKGDHCGCDRGTDARSGDAEGGDVKQSADQDNVTVQRASAEANPIQLGGLNLALGILHVGDTKQVNHNENEATAKNANQTLQGIGQTQVATGGDARSGSAWSGFLVA